MNKPPRPKRLDLTERDKHIIRAAYRYRLITTDQIQMFTNSSDRHSLNSRLRLLWGANYLDRPDIQKELFAYKDKRPTVHALGQRGADWLSTNHGIRFPTGKGWKTANKLKSSSYIEHRLGVSDTMFTFEQELQNLDGHRFIDRDEVILLSPETTHRLKDPYSLPTRIVTTKGQRSNRATKPDYTFAVGDLRGEKERRALLFLEWDNSTEDFVKTDPEQSSILGKYLRYADVYQRKLHADFYGFKNFRVLFPVNGESDRVAKMIATYQAHVADKCPAGTFLHATVSDIKMQGILAPIWITGKSERVSIL